MRRISSRAAHREKGWHSLVESCSVRGRGRENIKKKRKHTIKQAKGTTKNQKKHKHSIKQTIHQAHHQSNQTVSKERKQTSPKKKPYIKNFATPDRPPPAAVMLEILSQNSLREIAKSRKILSIDRPRKDIERGRCTRN